MKQFLKNSLLAGAIFLGNALFAVNMDYIHCREKILKWISGFEISNQKILKARLDKIDSTEASDEVKIKLLKAEFKDAFLERPILFKPPIIFEIQVNGIARKATTGETVVERTLFDDVKKEVEDEEKRKNNSVKREMNMGGGVSLETSAQFKASTRGVPKAEAGIKSTANVHFKLRRDSADTSESGWGRRKQKTFSVKNELVRNKLRSYKDPYFSITITLINKSEKKLKCDLSHTQIPIAEFGVYANTDKLKGKTQTLDRGCPRTIFFRAELDNDLALRMAEGLAKSDLKLSPSTFNNLEVTDDKGEKVDLNLGMVDMTPVYVRTPEAVLKWNVWQKHGDSADSINVLLSDALKAIDKDYFDACHKKMFDWQGETPVKLFGIPTVSSSFAESDKEERSVVFLQIGSNVYPGIPASLLTEPIFEPFTLWVVDLARPNDYLDAPDELREAIFQEMKKLAAKPESKPIHQFRLSLLYMNGAFGDTVTEEDKKQAVYWLKMKTFLI